MKKLHAYHYLCITLQRTATHCNTQRVCIYEGTPCISLPLQHITKYYTTLHSTVTLCNTMQNISSLQHAATNYKTPQHTTQHTATHCAYIYINRLHAQYYLCTTLQQTTKHCNTLQHTAIYCITLQHTAHTYTWIEPIIINVYATHCNTLQNSASHCNTLQNTTPHYNTLQHTTVYCNTLHINTCEYSPSAAPSTSAQIHARSANTCTHPHKQNKNNF